jgi:hypothetical protein
MRKTSQRVERSTATTATRWRASGSDATRRAVQGSRASARRTRSSSDTVATVGAAMWAPKGCPLECAVPRPSTSTVSITTSAIACNTDGRSTARARSHHRCDRGSPSRPATSSRESITPCRRPARAPRPAPPEVTGHGPRGARVTAIQLRASPGARRGCRTNR